MGLWLASLPAVGEGSRSSGFAIGAVLEGSSLAGQGLRGGGIWLCTVQGEVGSVMGSALSSCLWSPSLDRREREIREKMLLSVLHIFARGVSQVSTLSGQLL